MCGTCPTGSVPINGTLMLAAPCGQHWCVSDGNWKAVSRVRYQAELEAERLRREAEEAEREAARALLLGPNNIANEKNINRVFNDEPWHLPRDLGGLIHPGRNKIENEMFCPWLEDWPEEAPFEWTVTEFDNMRFRWQSPFVGTPGISTAWYECKLPHEAWKKWWDHLGGKKYSPRYPPVGTFGPYGKVVLRAYE